MKIRSLAAVILVTIATAIFYGFYFTKEQTSFIITVESNDAGKSANFDIAITKELGATVPSEFQLLENQHTPFKMELKNANYQIIIHKTNDAGNLTGQVEKRTNNLFKALASGTGNVVVLNTKKDQGVSAFEMK